MARASLSVLLCGGGSWAASRASSRARMSCIIFPFSGISLRSLGSQRAFPKPHRQMQTGDGGLASDEDEQAPPSGTRGDPTDFAHNKTAESRPN